MLNLEQLLENVAHHTQLGHVKRNKCFVRQVRAAITAPGASPARAISPTPSNWANAKSWYDFLGNDNIDIAQLRAIRRRLVAERLSPRTGGTLYP